MKNGKFVSCPKKITPKLGKGKYDRIIKKSENVLPKLKAKLVEVFHEYIRLRDSLPNGTFKCINCGKIKSTKNLQAGHFHKSELFPGVRFDEHNVNGECDFCNWQDGGGPGYARNLQKKIGADAMLMLEIKKGNVPHYGRFEYNALIGEYKNKVSSIKLQRESEHAVKMNQL